MEDLEQIKTDLENGYTVELSSSFTRAGAIFTVLAVGFIAVILLAVIETAPMSKKLIAGSVLALLVYLSLYQLIYAATAELEGKLLRLKKVIGKRYEVDVNQVEKVSMFSLKNTKYSIIRFKDNEGNPAKALILNSNSLLFGVDVAAGEVIKMAQKM